MARPIGGPIAGGRSIGLTRNSGPAELARAALESVGYQTRDLLEAMRADWGAAADGVLRVDGGMTASDWTMQFLSDILGAPVDRPKVTETTALGAAYLAAMQAGVIGGPEEFAKSWALDRRFTPRWTRHPRREICPLGQGRCRDDVRMTPFRHQRPAAASCLAGARRRRRPG